MILFLRFFLILVSLAIASILHIPDKFMYGRQSDILRSHFYPPHVVTVQQVKKPQLLYGKNCPMETIGLMNMIDSWTVEERLVDLRKFLKIQKSYNIANSVENEYQHYVNSSRFIDPRILRLLIRIATGYRNRDETKIKSACDIIKHLHRKYPPSSFNYVTSDYLLDWYGLIGGGDMQLSAGMDKQVRKEILSPNATEPVFVQLASVGWRKTILASRIARLERTGYEFL